jgi:hypothetical protein
VALDESAERPIISLFDIVGKKAGRQFIICTMIRDTLAADALPAARLIAAIAFAKILLPVALQN